MPFVELNNAPVASSGQTSTAFIELLGNAKLLAVIMNLRAEIIYCNAYFCEVTGWTRSQLEGRVWQEVLAPPGIGDLSGLFDDLVNEKPGPWHEENEIRTRDGQTLFVRWNYVLMKDLFGVTVAAGCIGENVTQRVLLQRKLSKKSEEGLLALQRELHDGLGQELFGISMTAKSLATYVMRGGVASQSALDSLATAANAAMQTCRSVARNVVTVSDVNGDLLSALKRLMQAPPNWQGPILTYQETVLNTVALSATASDHIFKIAQEALTNALKHARAANISLRVNVRASRIVLEMIDDGVGFAVSQYGPGLGLKLMRHRAGLLHAILVIRDLRKGVSVRLRCTVASNSI